MNVGWTKRMNGVTCACPAVHHVIYVIVSYFWLRDLRGRNVKCRHKLEDKESQERCRPVSAML